MPSRKISSFILSVFIVGEIFWFLPDTIVARHIQDGCSFHRFWQSTHRCPRDAVCFWWSKLDRTLCFYSFGLIPSHTKNRCCFAWFMILINVSINTDFHGFVHRDGISFCIGEYPIKEFFPFPTEMTSCFISCQRHFNTGSVVYTDGRKNPWQMPTSCQIVRYCYKKFKNLAAPLNWDFCFAPTIHGECARICSSNNFPVFETLLLVEGKWHSPERKKYFRLIPGTMPWRFPLWASVPRPGGLERILLAMTHMKKKE